MSKYRSYKVKVIKKSNKVKIIKICIVVIILLLGVKYHKTLLEIPGKVFKYFIIEKVVIVKNNTTLPENVLMQHFSKSITTFSLYKILRNIKKTYPEIKELRMSNLPFKKVKLYICSETPFCYTKNGDGQVKFFSKNKGWFDVYDISKIPLQDLIEFHYEPNSEYDMNIIENICHKFYNAGLNKKIAKILAKKNGEFVFTIKNFEGEQELVIDRNIYKLDEKEFCKFVSYIDSINDGKIYARLLEEGKVYIE